MASDPVIKETSFHTAAAGTTMIRRAAHNIVLDLPKFSAMGGKGRKPTEKTASKAFEAFCLVDS